MIAQIKITTLILFLSTAMVLWSCDKDKDTKEPEGSCYVHLFDGDNYKDDNIVIEGPGEFPDLGNLTETDKDWNDEADSFKSGENTTVTFWTETNFKGDSTTFLAGAMQASIDEPSSMKIRCE